MKGRPRKPPQLRLLEGHKGHRPIVFGPSYEKGGLGSCPKSLKGPARKMWKERSKDLIDQGLDAKAFGPMLEVMCYWYGEWRRWIIEVEKQATFVIEDSGYEGPRPCVKLAQNAFMNFKNAAVEFGFTPASNGKVTAPKTKKETLRDKLTKANAV